MKNKVMGNNNLTKQDLKAMDTILTKMGAGHKNKVVRRNDGLFERTSKDKVILTEDNRQILTD